MATDLLLRGGIVHDGLGSPGTRADVAVRGGLVAEIGRDLTATGEIIDCTDLCVCPGFIDPHCHSDLVPLMAEPQPFKLLQGVTTEIVGNCGISYAPLTADVLQAFTDQWSELSAGVEVHAGGFDDYMGRARSARPTNNIAPLVGHNTLRLVANGMEPELRPGALERMCALAAEAFAAGAAGLSTGLIYLPGAYSTTAEIIELARVAALHGVPYTTHMRDEGVHLEEALDEAIAIGRHAGVRVQISHCKAAGTASHGKSGALLDRLEAARRTGIDVYGDQYPYLAGATVLAALLPTVAGSGGVEAMRARLRDPRERAALRALAEGSGTGAGVWSQGRPAGVTVTSHRDERNIGHTIAEIAGERDPWDVLCELVADDTTAAIVLELMTEDDVVRIMQSPLVAVGSDNGVPVGLQHPRTWGTFPTVLGVYVRERGAVTLAEAIRKMTSLPARHFNLNGRGRLAPGAIADICVFDPSTVGHRGTYRDPSVQPDGITTVVLGGSVVVRDGAFSGLRAGTVIGASSARS